MCLHRAPDPVGLVIYMGQSLADRIRAIKSYLARLNLATVWPLSAPWRWPALLLPDVYLLLLLFYLLLKIGIGNRWWPIALVSELAHWLLLPAFALLILYLALRCWQRAVWASLSALVWISLFGMLYVPGADAPGCGSGSCQSLTVISFNAGTGAADPESLVALLRDADADLVGLQELSVQQAAAIEQALADTYPHMALAPSNSGTGRGLLSHHPISTHQMVDVVWEHLPLYLEATVVVDRRPLRVVVARLHPPRFGGYPEKNRHGETVWRRGYHTWQADPLADVLDQPGSAVLLVDLNAGPLSTAHRELRRVGLQDAWQQAGPGLGLTFPASDVAWHDLPTMPLVRIDYIWTTPDIQAISARLGESAGSDHRPVIATLRWMGE